MVTAEITTDRDKRECSLLVKGHAGHSIPGQDIVCASVTILAYTAAQVIKCMGEDGKLEGSPILELEGGDATLSCRAISDEVFSDLLQTFYTVEIGYKLLEFNYPQYVRLNAST